jgi:hypothetical protein
MYDRLFILWLVHVAIYNDTENHTLFSEFQVLDFLVQIDLTFHRHGGTHQMVLQYDGESRSVPLELSRCMIYFKHRLTNDEKKSLKQYCFQEVEFSWNSLVFSD